MLDTITATGPPATAATTRAKRALTLANTKRTEVAELKARLRRNELALIELVLDPPEEARSYLVFDVLRWPSTHRQTHRKLRALNTRAILVGHVNLAGELGALTARQRRWLADELDRR